MYTNPPGKSAIFARLGRHRRRNPAGGTLLLGVKIRWVALSGAATLVAFAVSMFIFTGFETPLSASVFTAAAAALLLMLAPPGSYTASLDHLHDSRTAERGTHK
jgi:uncharacterized membrane protein YphA (DoxX/SURF4 family)